MLSRDRAKAGVVNFGPVAIDASEQPAALWVVDGQQRITALVASLLRDELTPRGDYWSIWYDLEGEEFRLLLKKEAEPAWIPLNVVCDSVKLLKWIRHWPYAGEREDLVDRALALGKSVREYEMPAYIVEGAGQHLLRLIFTRSNTGGVGMRESEIFEALYGGADEKPIRSAVARLCDLGFGQLDEDLFLRCLRVTCGLSVTETIDSLDKLPKDTIGHTESALRRAIAVIKTAAGIPHWKLLPYRLPLVLLPALFHRFPEEDSRIDRLVAKWIWRGTLSGDHKDVTGSRVARLARQIRESASANEAMVALLAPFESANSGQLENSPLSEIDQKLSLGRASGKVFVLGLLGANPQRPNAAQQLTLWDEDEHPDDSDSCDSMTDPANNICWSLTGEGNFGSDTVIKVAGMRKKEILSADPETLRSFLLSEEAVRHLEALR